MLIIKVQLKGLYYAKKLSSALLTDVVLHTSSLVIAQHTVTPYDVNTIYTPQFPSVQCLLLTFTQNSDVVLSGIRRTRNSNELTITSIYSTHLYTRLLYTTSSSLNFQSGNNKLA
jgi:hypothetical protein